MANNVYRWMASVGVFYIDPGFFASVGKRYPVIVAPPEGRYQGFGGPRSHSSG